MDKKRELLCDNFKKCIKASQLLSALSNPNRIAIVCYISEGRKNVSQIVDKLKIPQSSVSLHLSKLVEKGWIEKERVGKNVYYKIKNSGVKKILMIISEKFINIKS